MIQRIAGLVVGALLATLIVAPAAWAQSPTPYVDIHSAGPLSDIYIGNDLGCQVRERRVLEHRVLPERRRPRRLRDVPDSISDNVRADCSDPTSPTTPAARTRPSHQRRDARSRPVSQTLTGSGTAANPYQVTTTVTLTIAHGHMAGRVSRSPRSTATSSETTSTGPTSRSRTSAALPMTTAATLYHAADCQLRGSDTGFGALEPTPSSPITAACTPNVLGNPAVGARGVRADHQRQQPGIETTVPTIWTDLDDSSVP